MSTEGKGSGSQAGPCDHTAQGTASSSADMPHLVTQDLLSRFSAPYLWTMSTEGTGSGNQARPSDHTVQGTASSSADLPYLVTQDLSLSLSLPYLWTMSTEGTGIGSRARPSDHIVQGTVSSSADMPHLVTQDLLSSFSAPYPWTMSTAGTGSGSQAGPSDHTVQGTASSSADMPHLGTQDLLLSLSPVTRKRGKSLGATMVSREDDIGQEDIQEEDIEQRAKKCLRSELKLEPQHKIFLSHSGKQKLFATYLCEGLEKRGHEPFFDRRESSLPKGEKFTELIIKAATQCEMLVVVVSEDYFMSKWPMIELSAFIQARKQRSIANAKKPKVLPLFYELSINEVRDEGNRQKWYKEWERFEGDDQIKLEDWKEAIQQIPSFNGIPYSQGDIEAYREAIVSWICSSIRPDVKWDDDHVQGKSNICEVVRKKVNESNVLKLNNAKVIGFHGVGGGGKTTMCKVLCNEFNGDFEGRVCHLEFKSKKTNLKKLLRKALMSLANVNVHDIEEFDEDQCLAKLRKVIGKKKVFMAIDNVWDDDEVDSIRKATKLMGGPFHEESVVVVTSRSLETLHALSLNEKSCFNVPELGEVDAMNLFKYHAFPQEKSLSEVESKYVLKCVVRCHFKKGNGDKHYHPLALEALGVQFRNLSLENLSDWEAKLQKVMAFDHRFGGNRVFSILKIGFDELSEDVQNLFMDVAKDRYDYGRPYLDTKWLCCVYENSEDELQTQLDILKRRGFLQDVDWTTQQIEIHDLYKEFAMKEMSGTFNKSDVFKNQKWMQMDVDDPIMRRGRNWCELIRLHVENSSKREHLEILRDWDLQYFSRVEVLTLTFYGYPGSLRLGILNLEPMKCLRSINVYRGKWWFHEVKGMEKLEHLYYFSFGIDMYRKQQDVETLTTIGQLPPSLKILKVEDRHAILCSSAVDRCTRLEDIFLNCIPPTIIDLSKFSSLKELHIHCMKFIQIHGLHLLISLKKLNLKRCEGGGHSEVNLMGLSQLQELKIYDCRLQIQCLPPHIRRLELSQGCDLNEDFVNILKTNALTDLEVLELKFQEYFKGSTDFKDVGRWPRLEELRLLGCNISKLPDLSESTKLKTIDISYNAWTIVGCTCYYEFQFGEDEVAMLSRLPQLQPICVGYGEDGLVCNFINLNEVDRGPYRHCKYIVDFSRRVLIKQEIFKSPNFAFERELGVAPYNLCTFRQNWENATQVKYIDYRWHVK